MEGMQIDRSEEQPKNAEWPRFEISEPGWNVNLDRFSHELKQLLEIVRTDEGIQID
jgi:hypothetical protein